MNYLINNINIHYEEYGKGEKILLLHGWGNDLNSFNKQLDCLKDKYHLYLIDLPGFGKTNEPNDIYSLDDYVKIVTKFIKNIIKEENIMIIGHSFGGRIGIKISTILNLKGLILISGAGIKTAYRLAEKHFIQGGNNRVFLATDGDLMLELMNLMN